MAEDRVAISPLDVPISRRDVLELLHEIAHRKGDPDQRPDARMYANALAQKFEKKWSTPPKPEKLETAEITDEAHDG